MAISKAMKQALKALSQTDIKMKQNYKLVRRVINLTHVPHMRARYHTWDYKIYDKEHEIPVRIFSPDEEQGHPIILYFHGGGWVTGNIDSYTNICSALAKKTAHTVISVDYRLAPEYRFPAAAEDCYHAAKSVFERSEEYFFSKPEEIVLMGDSAGGNLAAVVSLMARDRKEFIPRKQILLYPVVNNDFTENSIFPSMKENGTDYLLTAKRMQDYMELYKNTEDDINNPYFAPILAEDLKQQPNTLIITAQYDPLRDEGEAYGKRLLENGNKVKIYRMKDALHGFFSLSVRYPVVQEAYQLILKFLKEKVIRQEE